MFSFITSFAITLPETAIPDILANVSGIWGDLLPIIGLVISVFLAFWLIRLVIQIMTPHSKTPEWFEKDPYLTEEDKIYYRKRAHGHWVGKQDLEEDEEDEEDEF